MARRTLRNWPPEEKEISTAVNYIKGEEERGQGTAKGEVVPGGTGELQEG